MASTNNSQSLEESASVIKDRIDQEMRKQLGQRDWSIKDKIVLAAHILAREEHALYLAGQVTVRDKATATYWTTSMGAGLGNVDTSSIVRFDHNMNTVEGEQMPNPAVRFHVWVYDQRSDVHAIVHTHPPHASALSMLGENLVIAHMDAAMLFDDVAFLGEWPGVPLANEEGKIISKELGDKRAILLAHHGLLTAGRTLEEAVYLAVMFENAARLQLLAMSAGAIKEIDPALANEAKEFLMQEQFVKETFNYWSSQILDQKPSLL